MASGWNTSMDTDDIEQHYDDYERNSSDEEDFGDSDGFVFDRISSGEDAEQDYDDHDDGEGTNNDVEQDSGSKPPSIRSNLEKRLEVGSELESLDQVYALYCEYAHYTGFKVRKGSHEYFINSLELKTKVYSCSCKGQQETRYLTRVHKTDCKAKLRASRERGGPWMVSMFNDEHNHQLYPQYQRFVLPTTNHLPYDTKAVRHTLNSDGIGVTRACSSKRKLSGGPRNVGFTHEDVSADTSRLGNYTRVRNDDASYIMEFLADKSNEDLFYWNVQLDDNGRLMNFFFRDYQCLVDYEFFGDVLSVDATYRLKMNSLICVPFVGVNHHNQKIMFGMGFLSNETTESFEWLLKTFMKSMNKKEPQVVFSNQCQALMSGIDNTFRTATNRINHNAPSHFGSLNKNDEFKKMWHHCMNECETEDEFENSWKVMIETYDLSGHKWFGKMHDLRRRWASVFTNGRFSAGLHASPHCKDLKDLCSSSNSLHEFMLQTQQIQANWRTMEAEEDARCVMGIPGQLVENNEWLLPAARVYTRYMFKRFQCEALHLFDVIVTPDPDSSMSVEDLEFNVSLDSSSTRKWQVKFNTRTHSATCTCRMWETEGVLCRHIFKVYFATGVRRLPEQYFIKRWTRRAKVRDMESYAPGRNMAPDAWVKYIMRESYDMLMESRKSSKFRTLVNEHMVCLVMEFNAMRTENATFASPVQGLTDEPTEPQSEMGNMDLQLQLKHCFFDGENCDIQASQKTCSFPNEQCDASGGVKGKGKRKLQLFGEDIV